MSRGPVAEALWSARALIDDREAWQKGDMARAASGWVTHPDAPEAVCWCVVGAVAAVTPSAPRVADYLDDFVWSYTDGRHCFATTFNDVRQTTHAQVLDLLEEAAYAAEEEGL